MQLSGFLVPVTIDVLPSGQVSQLIALRGEIAVTDNTAGGLGIAEFACIALHAVGDVWSAHLFRAAAGRARGALIVPCCVLVASCLASLAELHALDGRREAFGTDTLQPISCGSLCGNHVVGTALTRVLSHQAQQCLVLAMRTCLALSAAAQIHVTTLGAFA